MTNCRARDTLISHEEEMKDDKLRPALLKIASLPHVPWKVGKGHPERGERAMAMMGSWLRRNMVSKLDRLGLEGC